MLVTKPNLVQLVHNNYFTWWENQILPDDGIARDVMYRYTLDPEIKVNNQHEELVFHNDKYPEREYRVWIKQTGNKHYRVFAGRLSNQVNGVHYHVEPIEVTVINHPIDSLTKAVLHMVNHINHCHLVNLFSENKYYNG